MSLERLGYIELPENVKPGGFDHAAVHRASGKLYVAHTVNDAVDVIDSVHDRYSHSIKNLTGVAGALVSDEENLVFTSNRGENTVGIFAPDDETGLAKIDVGICPNGLSYDLHNGLLLAANVGEPDIPDSFTLSIVSVPGRTRWTVFDAQAEVFYVNIAEPAQIVVVAADERRESRAPLRFLPRGHMVLILTRSTAAYFAPVTLSSWSSSRPIQVRC